MKIEHLIAQYLYINKKVTLQDIGVFYLSENITIPTDQDKDTVLPDNAITFEYNTKSIQDEGLIDYIVQQTRKIKPLATSDLESFTILGRQFMNIGKPLPIEGLGILQKNQHGDYEFIQGHTVNSKLEAAPAALKEKNEKEVVFTTPPRKPNSKGGVLAALIIFLLVAGAVAFYFVYNNNKSKKAEQLVLQKPDTPLVRKDTTTQVIVPKDTMAVVPPVKKDSFSFKVVIREYTTQATSDNVYQKFKTYGHKLVQYSRDSVKFKLAMPFTKPLSDTSRMRDSLKVLFGGKPYIEIN